MFFKGRGKKGESEKSVIYPLPAEDLGNYINLHYNICSVIDCMRYCIELEEREVWRAKLVELQLQHAAEVESFRLKYGDSQFLSDKFIQTQTVDWQNNKLMIIYKE